MKRNALLVAALAVVGVLAGHYALFANRAEDKVEAKAKKAPYVHVVLFHVKEGAAKDTADRLIADAYELLAPIPTIRELRCGRPAEMATPEFAKKDYDVGLVIFFDDFDGLKLIEHKKHVEYTERHLPNIDLKKLGVFDFIDQKK